MVVVLGNYQVRIERRQADTWEQASREVRRLQLERQVESERERVLLECLYLTGQRQA